MSAIIKDGIPLNDAAALLNDAAALTLIQGQAYRINAQVFAEQFPQWDLASIVPVDTTGPAWSPGVLTWTSSISGAAKWQSGYAKDVPLADVGQDIQLKTFHLAAIGYQWNVEEINTTLSVAGASLPSRRAVAARLAADQFLYNLALMGDAEKGLGGIANYPGVVTLVPPADGTGGVTYWVNSAGVGTKTPAQIVRDANLMLQGISVDTFGTVLADTMYLPDEAYFCRMRRTITLPLHRTAQRRWKRSFRLSRVQICTRSARASP